jgi:hypothetical protein
MASLAQMLKHFDRSSAVYTAFLLSHEELVHLFITAVNVHARLPALAAQDSYATFDAGESQISTEVLGKQLVVLEGLLQELQIKAYASCTFLFVCCTSGRCSMGAC